MKRIAAMLLLLTAPSWAQEAGTGHDTALPVEITATRLDLDQDAGTALFTGAVRAGQGDLRLMADRMLVEYVIADGKATRDIRRITATGNVTVLNGSEAAEGQSAVYTLATRQVEMTGDVLLTQGDNAIAGDVIHIDLDTGEAQVEGNVRTLIRQQDTAR